MSAIMQEDFEMDHINKVGGYLSSGRWKKVSLSRRGQKALTTLEPDDHAEIMMKVHRDSESLRKFGEAFKKKRGLPKESRAEFELESETGMIYLKIFDADTGDLQMVLSPEEVAKSLRELEEADDNATPLSSFFVDLTV